MGKTLSELCAVTKRTKDLIHDTHHLCMRLGSDRIKAMSSGFSRGNVIKSANRRNRGPEVVNSRQNKMNNF